MSIYKRFGSISKSGNVYWAIYWSFVTVTIGAVIICQLLLSIVEMPRISIRRKEETKFDDMTFDNKIDYILMKYKSASSPIYFRENVYKFIIENKALIDKRRKQETEETSPSSPKHSPKPMEASIEIDPVFEQYFKLLKQAGGIFEDEFSVEDYAAILEKAIEQVRDFEYNDEFKSSREARIKGLVSYDGTDIQRRITNRLTEMIPNKLNKVIEILGLRDSGVAIPNTPGPIDCPLQANIYYTFNCPYCGQEMGIAKDNLNCRIMRHYPDNGEVPWRPHGSREEMIDIINTYQNKDAKFWREVGCFNPIRLSKGITEDTIAPSRGLWSD